MTIRSMAANTAYRNNFDSVFKKKRLLKIDCPNCHRNGLSTILETKNNEMFLCNRCGEAYCIDHLQAIDWARD